MVRVALSILAVVVASAALPAHGGQYRGPRLPVTQPPTVPRTPGAPGTPTTGGGGVPMPVPRGPATPAPPNTGGTTGIPIVASEELGWQTWWEFNKEPFLHRQTARLMVPVSGSDDFYLGARRQSGVTERWQPTQKELVERAVPALAALLAGENNREVQGACLVALAKIGRDAPGFELTTELAARVRRDDQEVSETAVLALGIAGQARAVAPLRALLLDEPDGRRLVDREAVRPRTRAFAAYALGILARRGADPAQQQVVRDALWRQLRDPTLTDRDVRTAAVTAIGVLRADPERAADKRLSWVAVEDLLRWFGDSLGPSEETVQSHAPIAVARLLGRGGSPLHQQCKQRFAAELTAPSPRGAAILQSCTIALGMLVRGGDGDAGDVAAVQVLQQTYERTRDRATRQFAAIALGRIGGDEVSKWLQSAYVRGSKANDRPWLAIALGLAAEPAGRRGAPDAHVATMLLQDLGEAASNDLRCALVVGLGLTGYEPAAAAVQRLLQQNEADEPFAGYLCISLALLGDTSAVPLLQEMLERSARRPFLLMQCAVALGCLGDHDATARLLTMLDGDHSLAVLAAVAAAVGRIGDRRAIEPLVSMAADGERSRLARAFLAAALGGVGDKDELPWNTPFAIDCNYLTTVDTLTNGSTGVLDIL